MSYSPKIAKWQRTMLDAIKMSSGCVSCENILPTVSAKILDVEIPATWFDFDHVNPATKKVAVARMVGRYAYTTILAEVAKCQVLCKFCHALKTHK
jgi:L-lysine 2,3-aminomutase